MCSIIPVLAICVTIVWRPTILPLACTITLFLYHTRFKIDGPKWSLRLFLAATLLVLHRITLLVVRFLLQCVDSTLDVSNKYISAERIILTMFSAGILMIPSRPLWDTLIVYWVAIAITKVTDFF